MKKKCLAMLLAIVMVVSLLPGTAWAGGKPNPFGSCGENVKWSYSDGVLTIQGTGPMSDGDFLHPGYKAEIHTIIIEDGVTTIGNSAFSECDRLTQVTIPSSVTSIGELAFYFCRSLTNITIPDSVISIETFAFSGCDSLTEITIPNSVTTIGNNAFLGCSSLRVINLPDSITSIGRAAFQSCDNLTSVVIPGSVDQIGEYAFSFCENLSNVIISDGVKKIGEGAFNHIGQFSITIPASVVEIGNFAFDHMKIYGTPGSAAEKFANDDKQFAVSFTAGTAPEIPSFSDVADNAWYAIPVSWAVINEITKGTSDTTFSPTADCTHAQILTFLWRFNDCPKASKSPITVDASYQDAVNWAYSRGMIDDSFNPNAPCTRAEAVNYIWSSMGKREAEQEISFTDVPADNPYSGAINWAVERGITNGTSDTEFSPDQVCNRATIITFLFRSAR